MSLWDRVIKAPARPVECIRNFECIRRKKGRSQHITLIFCCMQDKISRQSCYLSLDQLELEKSDELLGAQVHLQV